MKKDVRLELPEKYETLTVKEMENIEGGEKKENRLLAEWLYKLLAK